MTIREEIGKRILFFDGGMGTLLQEQGLQAGELPETWNLKNPEPIIQIHKAYLAAGADIILANTFGANRFICSLRHRLHRKTLKADGNPGF